MCFVFGGPRTTKTLASRSEAVGRRGKNVIWKAARAQKRHSLILMLPIATGEGRLSVVAACHLLLLPW